MAAASKSSQKVKNVVIALLALWSIISLIVIVVWATSPDMKGRAQCHAELQEVTEKMEGAKVVYNKNKEALEGMVLEERRKTDQQRAENLVLLGQLNTTNVTLEECRQENVLLNSNMTIMQEDIEELRQKKANLTVQLGLLRGRKNSITAMKGDFSRPFHKTEAAESLQKAAENNMMAAQAQTKGCESSKQAVQKQLQKCTATKSEAPQLTQPRAPTSAPSSTAPLFAGIPALMLLVCSALHLIT
ncbi:uncharacterized protein si:ch211-1a19.3 [Neolamprologus brichardi]|uniref:uncharacterized protein si:ch211-1a19.3 n=1 Tax=Neolamprologus brichardi TaxID=32507 RepID=UPI00164374B5|nr:uncharacterized protein si:ch211-1a19.3 [Neolamprologus brichardi]